MELFMGACWNGYDQLIQHSFGNYILKGDQTVANCYAFCTGKHLSSIDIDVHEDFRRQGLGKLVGEACIQQSLEKGQEPMWFCDFDNEASLRSAKKLGYEEKGEYWGLNWRDHGEENQTSQKGLWESSPLDSGNTLWQRSKG